MCAPWICEISFSGVFRVVLDNRAVYVFKIKIMLSYQIKVSFYTAPLQNFSKAHALSMYAQKSVLKPDLKCSLLIQYNTCT